MMICVSLSGMNVKAAQTGSLLSPAYIPGVTANGGVYSLKSAYNTAKGNNSGIYIVDVGFLEDKYAYGVRDFPLYLMEDDFVNSDDKVKTYEVMFDGYNLRKIAYIEYRSTNMPDNIEAENDATAELYLSGKMQKLSGDPNEATNLFYYQIVLN